MNFKLTGRLVKKESQIKESKKINCKLQFRILKNGDKQPALCIIYDRKSLTSISEIITKIKEYERIINE
jgi:hypothetical protein